MERGLILVSMSAQDFHPHSHIWHCDSSLKTMNLEHAEDVKIAQVGGGYALDSGAVVVGGQQGIENTLAFLPVASHPA